MTNQKIAALSKGAPASPSVADTGRQPRGWRTRLASLLPLGLLVGFVVLLAVVLGDRLIPARELEVESVVTVRADSSTVSSTAVAPAGDPYEAPMLFQASGWIEPDPLPIKATALVDGIVEEVHVLEGDSVEKGQLLASLISEDAELNVRTAKSRLASLQAQTAAHHHQNEVAKAEIATLQKQVEAAKAKRDELADQAARYDSLPSGSVPQGDVAKARLQVATQEAEIDALEASGKELQGRVLQLGEVAKDFQARVDEAETEVARRQLDLDRTGIESPVDGVVLRLLAVPGQKRILAMDDPDSASIAILYQPDSLQARIDVPLEEAARLSVAQPVRIRSNFLPDRIFHGTVTRIVGEADLQRNTLQAKVRIQDPDARLRPEMLCRAEFLAPSNPTEGFTGSGSAEAVDRVRIFVPERALVEVSGDAATVWVLDESGQRATTSQVRLGAERREDHRLVQEGLKPGDRVIINPPADLEAGERVSSANH